MEVLWFLKERTHFIRWFYATATEPFETIIRKIEAEEAPYVLECPYDEIDIDEPPFFSEWQEADTGLQMVGHTCISMLSEALRLYFETWEAELGSNGRRTRRSGASRKASSVATSGASARF